MNDKDTLLACIAEVERLAQAHPDVGASLVLFNLHQMLDRSTDRWGDGFRAGLSVQGATR